MYISVDEIKNLRTQMRKKFPLMEGWKWSVTTMDKNVGVNFILMQYPREFNFPEHAVIDHHNPEDSCKEHNLGNKEIDIMVKACNILMYSWSMNSITHQLNFHPFLSIGKWDKSATKAPL